ncbi:hypothetical protein JXA02_05240 [candidate division KSB1 bacterium]|nr:hypothetical protein [candidate division KSB1 bacterium]RQW08105.1 MAG: hypothetical protein EH222_06025 [candidate division KSB1 bacterium]
MKKKNIKKSAVARPKGPALAFTRANYLIFALAIVVLIIGYLFLSIGPADSVQSLTIAPIILVIGYCVLVPLAIFWRKKAPAPTDKSE